MGKKRRQTGKGTATVDSALEAKGQAMITKIWSHYRRGAEANEAQQAGRQFPKDFAAEHGISVNTLRWEKRFAARYTKRQVEALCGLRRPNGLPLHWGHVMYLLGVDDLTQRKELERQAA